MAIDHEGTWRMWDLLRIKIPMDWGTTIDRVTTEINPFPYERETKHLTLKDLKTLEEIWGLKWAL